MTYINMMSDPVSRITQPRPEEGYVLDANSRLYLPGQSFNRRLITTSGVPHETGSPIYIPGQEGSGELILLDDAQLRRFYSSEPEEYTRKTSSEIASAIHSPAIYLRNKLTERFFSSHHSKDLIDRAISLLTFNNTESDEEDYDSITTSNNIFLTARSLKPQTEEKNITDKYTGEVHTRIVKQPSALEDVCLEVLKLSQEVDLARTRFSAEALQRVSETIRRYRLEGRHAELYDFNTLIGAIVESLPDFAYSPASRTALYDILEQLETPEIHLEDILRYMDKVGDLSEPYAFHLFLKLAEQNPSSEFVQEQARRREELKAMLTGDPQEILNNIKQLRQLSKRLVCTYPPMDIPFGIIGTDIEFQFTSKMLSNSQRYMHSYESDDINAYHLGGEWNLGSDGQVKEVRRNAKNLLHDLSYVRTLPHFSKWMRDYSRLRAIHIHLDSVAHPKEPLKTYFCHNPKVATRFEYKGQGHRTENFSVSDSAWEIRGFTPPLVRNGYMHPGLFESLIQLSILEASETKDPVLKRTLSIPEREISIKSALLGYWLNHTQDPASRLHALKIIMDCEALDDINPALLFLCFNADTFDMVADLMQASKITSGQITGLALLRSISRQNIPLEGIDLNSNNVVINIFKKVTKREKLPQEKIDRLLEDIRSRKNQFDTVYQYIIWNVEPTPELIALGMEMSEESLKILCLRQIPTEKLSEYTDIIIKAISDESHRVQTEAENLMLELVKSNDITLSEFISKTDIEENMRFALLRIGCKVGDPHILQLVDQVLADPNTDLETIDLYITRITTTRLAEHPDTIKRILRSSNEKVITNLLNANRLDSINLSNFGNELELLLQNKDLSDDLMDTVIGIIMNRNIKITNLDTIEEIFNTRDISDESRFYCLILLASSEKFAPVVISQIKNLDENYLPQLIDELALSLYLYLPEILRLTHDSNWRVQVHALKALSKDAKHFEKVFIRSLKDKDNDVREEALNGLSYDIKKHEQLFITALGDSMSNVRSYALSQLRNIYEVKELNSIIDSLDISERRKSELKYELINPDF